LEKETEKQKIKNRPIGPFPVVLVGADVAGRPNFTTVGACGVVCLEPILYVSLKSTHCSTAGIRNTGFFSVNIPSADMARETDYCGIVSGNSVDKSAVFTPFYDDAGKAPLIKECPLNFLCKVLQTVPIAGFEMFLGEIIATYAAGSCLIEGKPDPLKIDPMIMMGTGYYSLGETVGRIFRSGRD
jgi:flavin reductase (DIM6/NTAB) family NADH-FMN oxidoreductase RutF